MFRETTAVVSFQAPVTDILSFLQEKLDDGLAFSTVKVYLAAISACHVGFDDKTASKHPLVSRFMAGASNLRTVTRSLFPSWDLVIVLDGLGRPPFEPLESSSMKLLSFKTILLLALTTAKRVSDLHALSVSPECMRFGNDGRKVLLKPNLAFVPKNRVVIHEPVELVAFHPPPFTGVEDERLHRLCPVRALKLYCERTRTMRTSSQLFVSYGQSKNTRKAVAKPTLSRWIVEAIKLAYDCAKVPVPEGLRAHGTRGVSTSWAAARGVSVQEICTAANWSSPSTFAVFYNLDVAASSMAHTVLSVAASSS